MGVSFAVSLIIATIIMYLLAKHFGTPILRLTNKVKKISTGDLTVQLHEVNRGDELGQLNTHFDVMVTQLKTLISEVNTTTNDIQDASSTLTAVSEEATASTTEITRAVSDVSAGSLQQARDAEETKRVIIGISEQIKNLYQKTSLCSNLQNRCNTPMSKGLIIYHY